MSFKQIFKELADPIITSLILLVFCIAFALTAKMKTKTVVSYRDIPFSTDGLYAMCITTNAISRPCPCGFCDVIYGIRVPGHSKTVGYGICIEVKTNYYPIVQYCSEDSIQIANEDMVDEDGVTNSSMMMHMQDIIRDCKPVVKKYYE